MIGPVYHAPVPPKSIPADDLSRRLGGRSPESGKPPEQCQGKKVLSLSNIDFPGDRQ
jgi:hypothetical protein